MTADAREELRRLVHLSGRLLDDRRHDEFIALFEPNGRYRVEVKAPELPNRMVWMALARDELRERFDAVPEHEWRFTEQTRAIAVDAIDLAGEEARVAATVVVYQTDDLGRTECYAVARYDDVWRRVEGAWKLAERTVDLRTRLLPVPSPLPI
ncbi:MAG: nuclear transport factor 2 family protein [Alphaproteobacteria bacterium]